MRVTIDFELAGQTQALSGKTATVGWFLTADKGAVLYSAPTRVSEPRQQLQRHPKSASRCPAILFSQKRLFSVPSPFDVHLGFSRDAQGKPHLINRLGSQSPIRAGKIRDIVALVNEEEWRLPDRPIVQLMLPYCFIADEPIIMTQLPPFWHYRTDSLPGLMLAGRFPIDVWVRPLMWAFEWHSTERDLVLRRGEPLFYLQFETSELDRNVEVVRVKRTPELTRFMDSLSGVVNYVGQTFQLMSETRSLRPPKLVCPDDGS